MRRLLLCPAARVAGPGSRWHRARRSGSGSLLGLDDFATNPLKRGSLLMRFPHHGALSGPKDCVGMLYAQRDQRRDTLSILEWPSAPRSNLSALDVCRVNGCHRSQRKDIAGGVTCCMSPLGPIPRDGWGGGTFSLSINVPTIPQSWRFHTRISSLCRSLASARVPGWESMIFIWS